MLQHYIRIALRNLSKQKLLTGINIIGLSVGLACFSLFLLYAVNEFSYDRWHKDADRIFRVNEIWFRDNGTQGGTAGVYMPLGPAMKKDFPDVEDFVRIAPNRETTVRVNNQLSRLSVSFADPSFFSFFSFPLLAGTDSVALKDLNGVVLTRNRALQLFGSLNVIGARLEIKTDTSFEPFTVAGVTDNIPFNSSIQFDILGNFQHLLTAANRRDAVNSWSQTNGDQTFVRLRTDSRLMADPQRLLQFRFKYYPDEAGRYHKDGKVSASFGLQPLRSLHTTGEDIDAGPPGSTTDPKNIWILLGIAAGILLIAAINFTTLAIARSAGRAREVGVRKVIGGRRYQLIWQFLTESLLVTLLSAGLGWLLARLLLPYFNRLSDRELVFSFSRYPELTWMLAGLVLLIGILAGSYPALVLSGFRPVEVLKSKIKLGGANFFTRGLVTFQFALSIALIIATIVILQQVSYMRSKDLGLIKDNTIVVRTENVDAKKIYPFFRRTLLSRKEIAGVGASQIGLGEGEGQMGGGFEFNGVDANAIEYPVDADLITTLGMRLAAGRSFSTAIGSDTVSSVIVNEAFLKAYTAMRPEEAIGRQFKTRGDNPRSRLIIGVVKDFNFEPLDRLVRPQLFYMPATFQPSRFFVRVRAGQTAPAIGAIGEAWKAAVPGLPLRYSFLDEDLDRFYKNEARWRNIFACAGVISIILACLGLFGLASLAAINRLKEIGIRKLLGASIAEIVQLLASSFVRLVLLSSLIASPVAWYFMNRWLQHFAYRIDIRWWLFAATAIIALCIAVLTISVQAVRAALINPVKNLRTE